MNNANSLEKLYQEFGEDFCLCPFLGVFYQTNKVVPAGQTNAVSNTARPCSVIDFAHHAADINSQKMLDAMNSPDWIRLRRQFLAGEFRNIPECKNCSDAEKLGARSSRQGANQHFVHHAHSDLIARVRNIVDHDLRVEGVISLDYYPSNYCNYSCIMCAGGASSSRLTFEVKIRKIKERIVLNAVDTDFYDILQQVEILNFTGGETVMQQQVHDLIDYLIQEDLAKKITIFLLTNCSSYPDHLIEKFRHFYNVVYLCSIDAVGPVIEYQRRGANWGMVESNALRLIHHEFISTVVNVVLTAVNAPSITDLIDWFHHNRVSNVIVTPVFRVDHLGVGAMPHALRQQCLDRLTAAYTNYSLQPDPWTQKHTLPLIQSITTMIERCSHDREYLSKFREHILQEDQASKIKFLDAVPDWRDHWVDT